MATTSSSNPGPDIGETVELGADMGRKVSLSLADLFPRLSYGVIRQIDSEHHEVLFQAHNRHATQPLREGATKDFILTHIFRISPYLLSRPEDFWREVLRLHYRGTGLPDLLAKHVAAILKDTPLGDLPIAERRWRAGSERSSLG